MRYILPIFLAAAGLFPAVSFSQIAVPASVRMRLGSSAEIAPAFETTGRSVRAYAKEEGGFAITCGDRIVGYSNDESFNAASIPPALLEIIENSDITLSVNAVKASDLSPTAPLLGDMAWDQNEPFNLLCPAYYGTQKSATGCAATAMAQIMRHHCWPTVGQGVHSYSPERYTVIGELTVDFSKSVYDWDNMLFRYDDKASEEEQYAVARLMYDAGVAVSMDYGPESGTISDRWPEQLVKHFGYDQGVAIRYRSNYDVEEWNRIIRDEIDEGRPVFVTGFTELGGHAFVFDGYDENGMVHVNWGWSGMSNGYFDTEWLTPSTQGTGGSNGGFNTRQLIVTGIQPPLEGSVVTPCLISEEGLTSSKRKINPGESTALRLNGKVENVGWSGLDVDFGVMLADADGNPLAIFEGEKGVTLDKGAQCRNLSFGSVELPALKDASYVLYPVARNSEGMEWERIRDKDLDYPNYLTLTADGNGSYSVDAPEMASLSLVSLTPASRFFANSKGRVKALVKNDGGTEYKGNVALAILDPNTGKKTATGDAFLIDIMPGDEAEVEMTAAFSAAPGEYLLALTDRSGNRVGDTKEIELLAELKSELKAVGSPDFGDNDNVDPTDMHPSVAVSSAADAQYSGHLFLYFYNEGTSEAVGCLGPVYVQAVGEESVTAAFNGSFENLTPGSYYDVKLVDGETFTYVKPTESATARIHIAGGAAVETVGNDMDGHNSKCFNLQGQQISGNASGLHIEMRGGKAIKILK